MSIASLFSHSHGPRKTLPKKGITKAKEKMAFIYAKSDSTPIQQNLLNKGHGKTILIKIILWYFRGIRVIFRRSST